MIPDPQTPVVLATPATELEAVMIVNHLAEHGIKAQIAGSASPGGWVDDRFDMQVVVRRADLQQASIMLERLRAVG